MASTHEEGDFKFHLVLFKFACHVQLVVIPEVRQ
jgi:hypothetical protein